MTKKDEEVQNVENKDAANGDKDTDTTAESIKSDNGHLIAKSRYDEANQKYLDEKKRADALEKANHEAETKRLKEQEDYKALYEKSQQEITELKPKAEKVESLEAALKEDLTAQVEAIPEDKRTLIPDELSTEQQLKWISKNRALLSKAEPFDIGAGKQGGSSQKSVVLTQEQREMAKKTGVSEEEYAKNLN